MMIAKGGRAVALIGTLILASAAMQAASPPLLLQLEPGQWEMRGPNNALIGSVCLGDPARLLQPEHGTTPCPRTVLSSEPRSLTIRYTCQGTGFGRTTILVETPRLAQVDSQGIHNGAPFALHAEARRTGACH
jgi:hypothetical protein